MSDVPILIPTCRATEELADMLSEISATRTTHGAVVVSGQPGSAAFNRNVCLDMAGDFELGIMLDDDLQGFYRGWDADLLQSLSDPLVEVASARLLDVRGRPAQTCSRCYDLSPEHIEIKPGRFSVLPTAAIAFRNRGLRFDETFRGSGFEDSDWCYQYLHKLPHAKFIQNNVCRLVHRNEMKFQRENWTHNQEYFTSKWIHSKQLSHG